MMFSAFIFACQVPYTSRSCHNRQLAALFLLLTFYRRFSCKNQDLGAGKMAQWTKCLPCKPGDPSVIPRIHRKVVGENLLHKVVL